MSLRVSGTAGGTHRRCSWGHSQDTVKLAFLTRGPQRDRDGRRSRLGARGGERASDSEGRSRRARVAGRSRSYKGDPARRTLRGAPSPRESPAASWAGTSPGVPRLGVRQPFIFLSLSLSLSPLSLSLPLSFSLFLTQLHLHRAGCFLCACSGLASCTCGRLTDSWCRRMWNHIFQPGLGAFSCSDGAPVGLPWGARLFPPGWRWSSWQG